MRLRSLKDPGVYTTLHIRDVAVLGLYGLSSFFSFGLFLIRGRQSRYLHFYDMAFVLRSDALPATNPLIRGKTGPPVFHIKVGASH